MKRLLIILFALSSSFISNATIHKVGVWDGYFQFRSLPNFSPPDITIQLGDTVQWLPVDVPIMIHTITSTNIPVGATSFDQIWQAPVDTFFQYIPQIAGFYEYECTPHAGTPYFMIASINVIGGATGISNNPLRKGDLHIYPNPTTDFIRFKESSITSNYKIFDLEGKHMFYGKTNDIVSVSSLENGTYFLEIIGDKPRIVKFIKQ